MSTDETIEEFLARGGKIQVLPVEKKKKKEPKKRKPKSHKALRDQAAKAFPEAEQLCKERNEQRASRQKSREVSSYVKKREDKYIDESEYTKDLEDILTPKKAGASYLREHVLLGTDSKKGTYLDPDIELDHLNLRLNGIPWQTGVNDEEVFEKYKKPYLTERESRLMFLRLACNIPFGDIAITMKIKSSTLRQLWLRTKKKVLEKEGERVK